jgi:GTP-binding protein EngB required for normal cell division
MAPGSNPHAGEEEPVASELEALEAKARELASVASSRPEARRAELLADRLAAGRFVVSVVGDFKRGKSTLLNALVGEEVLPTGVVPVTAIATELAFGDPSAEVELFDGSRRSIGRDELAAFVTEAGNPDNERQVARVEVRGRWPLLAAGVVLVDTPGIGSVHAHNTEAARRALLDADGAVLVMAADMALSEGERDLVRTLAERRAPTFYVLNKVDRLEAAELEEVRCFVTDALCAELDNRPRIFALSARAALRRLDGHGPAGEVDEFDVFVRELERFIADDLVGARVAAARRELARLGSRLRDGVAIERAAATRDRAALGALVERFRAEAVSQRRRLDDDRTLLDRDVRRLVDESAARLADHGRRECDRARPRLESVAITAPRGRLRVALRDEEERIVRESFETFRKAELDRVEREWGELAQRFRSAVCDRVNEVRAAAADLFEVPLPEVSIAAVAQEREQFFYLFLHVGGTGESFDSFLRRLVPSSVARRRALRRATAELAAEFDKHAGRARADLAQRLDAVRNGLERAMTAELEDAVDAILEAAHRGEDRAGEIDAAIVEERAHLDREALLADELAHLGEEAR